MGTKEMRNRIVAKTGSMTGISTLAGYAHTNDAHTLAFVIMNQNVLKLSQARAWQDKVCRALVTAKRE
jgi:D-alanyl-D-alanine carboxypeptidase/D-alanyl-D-alanine-endopeptidase (penicillin-binding protein 4)